MTDGFQLAKTSAEKSVSDEQLFQQYNILFDFRIAVENDVSWVQL
jgi:hypothetical protein